MCNEIIKGQMNVFDRGLFEEIKNKSNTKAFMYNGKRFNVYIEKCNYKIDGYRTGYKSEVNLLLNDRYGKRNNIRTIHKLIKEDIPISKEEIKIKEYKAIDNIFNGVEELFYKVQDRNLEDIDELDKYDYVNNQVSAIIEQLSEKLNKDKEGLELIEKLDLLNSQLIYMESLYYFKQGIELSITK